MLRQFVGLLLVSTILLQSAGCTVIFATVGANSDKKHPRMKDSRLENIVTAKPETAVSVTLNTGGTMTGRLAGLSHVSESEYETLFRPCYLQYLQQISFPDLHTAVTIIRTSGHVIQAHVTGIAIDSLGFRLPDDTRRYMLALNDIQHITGADTTGLTGARQFHADEIRKLIMDRQLPVSTVITLETQYGLKNIPVEQIAGVKIGKRRYTGLILGVLGGAALDFLAFLAFVLYTLSGEDLSFPS